MGLSKVHPALRELLAVFEAWRKLGFTSDQIYALPEAIAPDAGLVPALVLRAQGRQFIITAPAPFPKAEFVDAWIKAAEAWNKGTDEERDVVWRGSVVYKHAVPLVTAMIAKGFNLVDAARLKRAE